MENKDVPFIVHEGIMSRMERNIKRLFILLMVAIACLVVTNAVWIYAWMQYDYSGNETVTVDGRSVTAWEGMQDLPGTRLSSLRE